MKYVLDCEFDFPVEKLISMALIREDGKDLYIRTDHTDIVDPWVVANIIPILDSHTATETIYVKHNEVGSVLRAFLKDDDSPIIVSDSTADIGYFTRAYGVTDDGQYSRLGKKRISFIVENVKPFPTDLENITRHNAHGDALALQRCLGKKAIDQIQRDYNFLDSIYALMKMGHETEARKMVGIFRKSNGEDIFET